MHRHIHIHVVSATKGVCIYIKYANQSVFSHLDLVGDAKVSGSVKADDMEKL